MRFLHLVFVVAIAVSAIAAEEVVEMKPFRVTSPDVYFYVRFDTGSGKIIDVRVTEVKPASLAEKLGLRKGDFLIVVDGKQVAGQSRGMLVRNRAISLLGRVTFTGRRGFLRKAWSLTIDADQLKSEKGA